MKTVTVYIGGQNKQTESFTLHEGGGYILVTKNKIWRENVNHSN